MTTKKKSRSLPVILLILVLIASAVFMPEDLTAKLPSPVATTLRQMHDDKLISTIRGLVYKTETSSNVSVLNGEIPEYEGSDYTVINNDTPYFTEEDKAKTDTFIKLSELDSLGRCGVMFARVDKSTMPTEERCSIGHVKPSGWNQAKYPGIIKESPSFIYNRCHLGAFCLTSLNSDERNLITGTRHFNVEGMLPIETMTVDYIEQTGNSVLYRVTPIYDGNDLVAKGVLMEGLSSDGKLKFCRFVHNIQPGITIDYATGESRASE